MEGKAEQCARRSPEFRVSPLFHACNVCLCPITEFSFFSSTKYWVETMPDIPWHHRLEYLIYM